MKESCPNCQAILVPSVVGYLCSECGSVHRFYKTDPNIDQGSGAIYQPNNASALSNNTSSHHQTSHEPSQQRNHTVQHHTDANQIKQPPVPRAQLGGDHQSALSVTDPPLRSDEEKHSEQPSIGAAQDSRRDGYIHDHPKLNKEHGHDQTQVIDQQALTEARHYRKKLRHRLKTMVIPELPDPYAKKELSSTYDNSPIRTDIPPRPADSIPTYADPYLQNTPGDTKDDRLAKGNLPNMTIESVATPHPLRNGLIIFLIIALISGAIFVIVTTKEQQTNKPIPSQTINQLASVTPSAPIVKTNDNPDAIKRDDTRKKDLKDIATALEVYRRDNGNYPLGNDINVLYPLQYTSPPYISYINYDPSSTSTNKIKYGYSSDGINFKLTTRLEILTDPDARDGMYTVTNTKN